MFKLVAFSAFLAVARAGGLLSYSANPVLAGYAHAALPYAAAPLPYAAAPLPYAAAPLPYAAASLPYAAAAPVAIHAPAVGTTHQSTLRSLDGNSAISHYSKSVDTAFSSVRKVDTRVTNDAKIIAPALAPAALTYTAAAAPLIKTAAPLAAYAPAYASAIAPEHVVAHTAFTGFGTAYAF